MNRGAFAPAIMRSLARSVSLADDAAMDRVLRLVEVVALIVDAAIERPLDGLDVKTMLARNAELRRLALVTPTFHTCTDAALVEFVLLRSPHGVKALGAAIDGGRIDAARITHVALAPIVPSALHEEIRDKLWDVLDGAAATKGASDEELDELWIDMLGGITEYVRGGGGNVLGFRPFCQAFGRLRPKLTALRSLEADGYRAMARAPASALWLLPAEVTLVFPPLGSMRDEEYRFRTAEADVSRMTALLDHSPETRLHLRIMSDSSYNDHVDQDVEMTRPLWPRAQALTFGSARSHFRGCLPWHRPLDELDPDAFPALRRMRLHLERDTGGVKLLAGVEAIRHVEELHLELGASWGREDGGRADDLKLRWLDGMGRLRALTLAFTDILASPDTYPSSRDVSRDRYLAVDLAMAGLLPALQSLRVETVKVCDMPPIVQAFNAASLDGGGYHATRQACESRGINFGLSQSRRTSSPRIGPAHRNRICRRRLPGVPRPSLVPVA